MPPGRCESGGIGRTGSAEFGEVRPRLEPGQVRKSSQRTSAEPIRTWPQLATQERFRAIRSHSPWRPIVGLRLCTICGAPMPKHAPPLRPRDSYISCFGRATWPEPGRNSGRLDSDRSRSDKVPWELVRSWPGSEMSEPVATCAPDTPTTKTCS